MDVLDAVFSFAFTLVNLWWTVRDSRMGMEKRFSGGFSSLLFGFFNGLRAGVKRDWLRACMSMSFLVVAYRRHDRTGLPFTVHRNRYASLAHY